MSAATDNAADTAVAAGIGALGGHIWVARSGMSAIGLVGSGAGMGAALGPVGIVGGALVGITFLQLFKLIDELNDERKAMEEQLAAIRTALIQGVWWAKDWAEEAVEVTGNPEDHFTDIEATASFDRWLNEMFDDQRPQGWQIWTSRMVVTQWLAATTGSAAGVRLRDWNEG